jgi:hypothetical protein
MFHQLISGAVSPRNMPEEHLDLYVINAPTHQLQYSRLAQIALATYDTFKINHLSVTSLFNSYAVCPYLAPELFEYLRTTAVANLAAPDETIVFLIIALYLLRQERAVKEDMTGSSAALRTTVASVFPISSVTFDLQAALQTLPSVVPTASIEDAIQYLLHHNRRIPEQIRTLTVRDIVLELCENNLNPTHNLSKIDATAEGTSVEQLCGRVRALSVERRKSFSK